VARVLQTTCLRCLSCYPAGIVKVLKGPQNTDVNHGCFLIAKSRIIYLTNFNLACIICSIQRDILTVQNVTKRSKFDAYVSMLARVCLVNIDFELEIHGLGLRLVAGSARAYGKISCRIV